MKNKLSLFYKILIVVVSSIALCLNFKVIPFKQNILYFTDGKATKEDLSRIAEIFVFNNRINYFPIFKQEDFSFGELQVVSLIENYFGKTEIMDTLFVAEDNGIIKGFMEIRGTEIGKLYVEPCFQSGGVGDVLIKYAIQNLHVDFLWALEKNTRARAFYNCHGFIETGEKEHEEGTMEYLLKLVRREKV